VKKAAASLRKSERMANQKSDIVGLRHENKYGVCADGGICRGEDETIGC
jgi:hypothetical protein